MAEGLGETLFAPGCADDVTSGLLAGCSATGLAGAGSAAGGVSEKEAFSGDGLEI